MGLDKNRTKIGLDRDDHPIDLHPGSLVTLPELDLILAQAEGSIFPTIDSTQTVISMGKSVGYQTLFGLDIYNSYLSDQKSFVRTVADPKTNKILEVTLFTLHDRIMPSTVEEWELWLGKYANGTLSEAGLIGWPQFQIDGSTPIIYNRAWLLGDQGIAPTKYQETVINSDKKIETVNHEAMEYVRWLSDSTAEQLYVTVTKQTHDTSINIYIGIPLNKSNLKVIAV